MPEARLSAEPEAVNPHLRFDESERVTPFRVASPCFTGLEGLILSRDSNGVVVESKTGGARSVWFLTWPRGCRVRNHIPAYPPGLR